MRTALELRCKKPETQAWVRHRLLGSIIFNSLVTFKVLISFNACNTGW